MHTDIGMDSVTSCITSERYPRNWIAENGAACNNLGVNSVVEVDVDRGNPVSGTIRWVGRLPLKDCISAGVELDDDKGMTDGSYLGEQYFTCPSKRGIFVRLQSCRPDSRFHPESKVLRTRGK
nr:PREDICTED: ubiquitin carboxyl-terminal hydrolase CYLD-like [Latimeria chalumnae]|eukprot:XP_006009729.1 PREDICTED: ubiquitin carboxyl-terminal hydrolase CYLD-like [Latimeria chalumnae]